MNNIIKKLSCLLMVFVLGYVQIGCQSENVETSSQVVKDSSVQVTNDEENNDTNENLDITHEEPTSNAEIHFINTGNSDATLIIQDGKAALIDGGDNDDEKLVVSYLKNQGIDELEYVFATHPHADHIGGLDAVVNEIKVNNLYISNGDADTKTYREFINAASNKGLYASVPLLGSEFKLGTATFKVLSVANSEDTNNNSIVLQFSNGNDKVLLMGDAEKEVERELNPGKIDLLKVGHHGSHSSSSQSFIDKIEPEYAVILASKDNKYGHPHKETVDLFKSKSIEIHRSDECGDIIFKSTGNGLEISCNVGSYSPGANSKYNNKNESTSNIDSNKQSEQSQQYDNESENVVSQEVYWTSSGKKYHSRQSCSNMKSPISGTIEESGRTACSKCY